MPSVIPQYRIRFFNESVYMNTNWASHRMFWRARSYQNDNPIAQQYFTKMIHFYSSSGHPRFGQKITSWEYYGNGIRAVCVYLRDFSETWCNKWEQQTVSYSALRWKLARNHQSEYVILNGCCISVIIPFNTSQKKLRTHTVQNKITVPPQLVPFSFFRIFSFLHVRT